MISKSLVYYLSAALAAHSLAACSEQYSEAELAQARAAQQIFDKTPGLDLPSGTSTFTGAAHTSYRIQLPPAFAGDTPEVTLTYSSDRVDGMHTQRNSQTSWLGLGWELHPGAIVRHMKACANGTADLDQCLTGDSFSISLGGVGGRLIADGDNRYRIEGQPHWLVEHHTDGGPDHPDHHGEYWRVTGPDGVRYRFGGNADPETGRAHDSVRHVPVYDTKSSVCGQEPFDLCSKAYQWDLDRVEDPNGNLTAYYYEQETNHYKARNDARDKFRKLYVRAAYLRSIEYGRQSGSTDEARARVLFHTEERCLDGGACAKNEKDYPDTPFDKACESTGSCSESGPTFWTTKRLGAIETQVRGSDWRSVLRYTLSHGFPDPDDSLSMQKLWLASITRAAADGSTSLPPRTFEPVMLQNRVNAAGAVPDMEMPRIRRIVDERGGETVFEYGQSHPCKSTGSNIRRTDDCYVEWDAGKGRPGEVRWVLWNKWKVLRAEHRDPFAESEPVIETYEYGQPNWRYNDKPSLPEVNGCSGCPTRYWNEFHGHDRVTITDSAGQKTVLRYFTGMDRDRLGIGGGTHDQSLSLDSGESYTDHDWLTGQLIERTVLDASGSVLESNRSQYRADLVAGTEESGARLVVPESQRATVSGASSLSAMTEYRYDDRGNVTLEFHHGDSATTGDDRTIIRSYRRDLDGNVLDRPSSEIMRQGLGESGAILSRIEHAYDARGNRIETRVFYSDSASALTRMEYDALGRPERVTDPRGAVTTTTYHPEHGHRHTVTNHLGHTERTEIDPGLGNVLEAVDANGNVTRTEYDGLGRAIRHWEPTETSDALPSVVTEYTDRADAPDLVRTRTLIADTGSYHDTFSYYDGFGRVIQTQEQVVRSSDMAVTSTRYDGSGRRHRHSAPYAVTGTAGAAYVAPEWSAIDSYSEMGYDALGRIVHIRRMSRGQQSASSRVEFDGKVARFFDENGHRTDHEHNALGLIARTTRYLDGAASHTHYDYDGAGRLVRMTDAQGNETTIQYNLRGDRTELDDPDRGVNRYIYNAAGDLTRQIDGRGVSLFFDQDILGRTTRVRDNGGTLADFTYDAGNGQLGHLVSSRSFGLAGTIEVDNSARDAAGRVTRREWTISGQGTFAMEYRYAPGGARIQVDYPGGNNGQLGERVRFVHDPAGRLDQVIGDDGTHYVSSTLYSVHGKPRLVKSGRFDSELRRFSNFYPSSQRTQRRYAEFGSGANLVQDLRYAYDPAGNVSSILDAIHGDERQCFEYDERDRLTSAFTGNAGCNAFVDSGPLSYFESYDYDEIDNLVARSGATYQYNAAQPHALTSAMGSSYAYDGSGNQTRRVSGGVTHDLSYDSQGRLERILRGGQELARFGYDAARNRILRSDDAGTTITLEGLYERKVSGSAVETTSFYPGPAGLAAIRRTEANGASEVLYVLTDHRGSTLAMMDTSGDVAQEYRYLPFGELRDDSDGFDLTRTFTGQERAVDLPGFESVHHYNARWYDAQLGRFLQADPVIPDPGTPASLNRYSYVHNNPIKHTDPTGHWLDTALDIVSLGVTINDIRREGFTTVNTLSLAADVGALILPGVAGGGLAVKAVARSGRLARAGNRVRRAVSGAARTAWGAGRRAAGATRRAAARSVGTVKRAVSRTGQAARRASAGASRRFDRALFGDTAGKTRVFWSGGNSATVAAGHARRHGKITLEMTRAGRFLDRITTQRTFPLLQPAWRFLSRQYARGATGTVDAFLSSSRLNPNGVWMTVERPVLLRRGISYIEHWLR